MEIVKCARLKKNKISVHRHTSLDMAIDFFYQRPNDSGPYGGTVVMDTKDKYHHLYFQRSSLSLSTSVRYSGTYYHRRDFFKQDFLSAESLDLKPLAIAFREEQMAQDHYLDTMLPLSQVDEYIVLRADDGTYRLMGSR